MFKKINIHTLSFCCTLILFFFSTSRLKAQGFLKAEGTKIVNEKGENVLLRGIGLGGWMLQEGYMLKVNREGQQYRIKERLEELVGQRKTQEFYEAWLANHTRKVDIDSMKAWGFNSVRLPMHYNLYTLPIEKELVKGKNTWLEKGFAMTDALLAWCKANKMYLILDLHAAPGGQGNDLNISDRDPSKPSLWDSPENQQKTIALWKKLAERYANEPWIGGYDILNEPNWGFEDPKNDKNGTKEKVNTPLKKLMTEITKAIRAVDQKHMVIIEGNGWGNNYNGILPQWDDNMVLSYHKYWNYNTQESIAHMLKARKEFNIPVWLGETGENSNVWFTEAIRLLETNNIGWAWWPLKKIGSNNPMEIKSNANYNHVVNYLNQGGDKPKEADAHQGIMELAAAARLENTTLHRDVIDAMIRQPFSIQAKPFKKHDVGQHTLIHAVDYDLGRNGIAYFDTDTADYHVSTGKGTPGNRGHVYRNDGVDIFKDGDQFYVGHIEAGEWLQYTVNVLKKGTYTIKLKIAAAESTGQVSILANGQIVSKAQAIPTTGGEQNFQFLEVKGIVFNQGKQTLKILADIGGFNLCQIQLVKE